MIDIFLYYVGLFILQVEMLLFVQFLILYLNVYFKGIYIFLEVVLRIVWVLFFFKCCCVGYNIEVNWLEICKGEYVGKIVIVQLDYVIDDVEYGEFLLVEICMDDDFDLLGQGSRYIIVIEMWLKELCL